MPCIQVADTSAPYSPPLSSRSGPFTSEADCLNACKEGACCEGETCSIKPQCQCQGTGKTFKGVGTTCTPSPCGTKCYRQNGYRAVLYAKASGPCAECRKSKLVGFYPTYQEASNALSAYQAEVIADPECVVQSQQIVPLEITASCYESAPDNTWVLKSTYQTREECQSLCVTEPSCPKGVCIKVGGDCFRRDCPDNPNTFIPAPCNFNCGDGTYYEWECYKFAPGETIADYQWAVDDYEGYEVDWCTGAYYNAFHALYMPVDKCPADAAQYWSDATCPLGCRQQPNPLP